MSHIRRWVTAATLMAAIFGLTLAAGARAADDDKAKKEAELKEQLKKDDDLVRSLFKKLLDEMARPPGYEYWPPVLEIDPTMEVNAAAGIYRKGIEEGKYNPVMIINRG